MSVAGCSPLAATVSVARIVIVPLRAAPSRGTSVRLPGSAEHVLNCGAARRCRSASIEASPSTMVIVTVASRALDTLVSRNSVTCVGRYRHAPVSAIAVTKIAREAFRLRARVNPSAR